MALYKAIVLRLKLFSCKLHWFVQNGFPTYRTSTPGETFPKVQTSILGISNGI